MIPSSNDDIQHIQLPNIDHGHILGMYWHEGLGDVLMQLGDTQQAALHYEEAVGLASSAPLKNPLRAKLAKAQAKTGTLPKP